MFTFANYVIMSKYRNSFFYRANTRFAVVVTGDGYRLRGIFARFVVVLTKESCYLCCDKKIIQKHNSDVQRSRQPPQKCICMSQKTEKPVLSGQRIKTRKRDEKEKYDPTGFGNAIMQGLDKAGKDLDEAGSKLDYRRYGEALFDILIAGGLLMPGGSIATEGGKVCKKNVCIFDAPEYMESVKNFAQVFLKLMRRYKCFMMKKFLMFIEGFNESERVKLARMTALWLSNGSIPQTVLHVLINDHLIKDNLASEFLVNTSFVTFEQEKGLANVITMIKKGNLEGRLMEFVPPIKKTGEHFRSVFEEKGLNELIQLHKAQASQEVKRDLQQQLREALNEGRAIKEITTDIRDYAAKNSIPEQDVVAIIWSTVMALGEWNKKEELVAEKALKHLNQYTVLFDAFTNSQRSELQLMLRVQKFCYCNMNFMKVFQRIILLFYKTDVLSEEVIVKWYNESHSVKGKMMFLDQMKKFVEWLQNAEEESESGGEED